VPSLRCSGRAQNRRALELRLWVGRASRLDVINSPLAAVNFPPRQFGKHLSEVLTLGVPDENGNVVLLRPDRGVPLGGRVY